MLASGFHSFGAPTVLELVELPDLVPGPGQVRVRVRAATVNPADTSYRAGEYAAAVSDVAPPYVGGLEFAGHVDQVGAGVALRPGTPVMGMTKFYGSGRGAHAEQVLVDQRSLTALPNGLSMELAATVPMSGLTARLALDRFALTPGQTLAITGAAGSVGAYTTQLAANQGIRVIAISTQHDEGLLKSLGAELFVPRAENFAAAVRELLPGGADAVLDAAVIGAGALELARDGGHLVSLRPFAGDAERAITVERISVRDYLLETQRLSELGRAVEGGQLTPRLAATFAAKDAPAAHELVERGGRRGGAVLRF